MISFIHNVGKQHRSTSVDQPPDMRDGAGQLMSSALLQLLQQRGNRPYHVSCTKLPRAA